MTKKSLDGKKFVMKLEACKSKEEIFALLLSTETMTKDIIQDRIKNVSNQDVIVNFHGAKAAANAKLGFCTSHQDAVNMAAEKYLSVENDKKEKVWRPKTVLDFKTELNKYITQHDMVKQNERDTVAQDNRLANKNAEPLKRENLFAAIKSQGR